MLKCLVCPIIWLETGENREASHYQPCCFLLWKHPQSYSLCAGERTETLHHQTLTRLSAVATVTVSVGHASAYSTMNIPAVNANHSLLNLHSQSHNDDDDDDDLSCIRKEISHSKFSINFFGIAIQFHWLKFVKESVKFYLRSEDQLCFLNIKAVRRRGYSQWISLNDDIRERPDIELGCGDWFISQRLHWNFCCQSIVTQAYWKISSFFLTFHGLVITVPIQYWFETYIFKMFHLWPCHMQFNSCFTIVDLAQWL